MTMVEVRGTVLHAEQRGEGAPLLLMHGGGEDASMLAPQAEALAANGYRVITYDRRGTGRSGRHDWPGEGADQHADDAAALLAELGAVPATVVGVSSGGVVALTLAALHPDVVSRVVAWEPPAIGIVPGGQEMNDELMAPIGAYLAGNPGDYVGAQAILLSMILGFPVAADDPAFAPARANAESMIRGEPAITLRPFTAADLRDADVTIGLGSQPLEFIRAAAGLIAEWTGRAPVEVAAGHEVYLTDPSVLAKIVG